MTPYQLRGHAVTKKSKALPQAPLSAGGETATSFPTIGKSAALAALTHAHKPTAAIDADHFRACIVAPTPWRIQLIPLYTSMHNGTSGFIGDLSTRRGGFPADDKRL